MKTYHDLLRHVLEHGLADPNDRTGVGTLSVFGPGIAPRYDLADGFPLLTTKYVHFKSVVAELLWFISGSTNIRPLLQENVHIWSEWPHAAFNRATGGNLSVSEFEKEVLRSETFAAQWGDIGPCYGRQWRRWSGAKRDHDQLGTVIDQLRTRPNDRGIIMNAWNVEDLGEMALRPCHTLYQWKVDGTGRLNCVLYQRSADIFLGVPFNIASAALLTTMLAHVTGYRPGLLTHTFGDLHIYNNHRDQVLLQLSREPKKLPTVRLNPDIRDIDAFRKEDIVLENYEHWPAIRAQVAV